jgi:glutamyl-tRNA synthetase
MRTSANTLAEIALNLVCYFKDITEYNQKAIEKFIGNSDQVLVDLKEKLSQIEDWSEDVLDELLVKYRNKNELPIPKVNQPIRIALTGSTNSPSLGMTLYLFKKNEAIARIDKLINFINHKDS